MTDCRCHCELRESACDRETYRLVKRMDGKFLKLCKYVEFLSRNLDSLEFVCRALLHVSRRPGMVAVQHIGGSGMALQFEITLPALVLPHDVETRRLSYKIGDAEVVVLELAPSEGVVPDLVGEDGATLAVTLTDVDDAGNESPTREQSFVLVDTIPPAQPGEIGVKITGEV